MDCSGGDEVSEESGFRRKAAALFAVLQEQRAERAIVFCNKIETCRKVRLGMGPQGRGLRRRAGGRGARGRAGGRAGVRAGTTA